MKFTKKFMSVLLAVVLVLGSLSVCAFAWTGDGTQQAKITIVPDKTTVSAGDTVNFDIVMNLDENATWATFGNFLFSFMYNSDVLTPETLTYGPTVAEFSMARTLGIVTATNTISNVRTKSTTADQAIFDANGYNAMCRVQCAKDANSSLGSQGYWEATDGEVLATITCTVAEGVADGTPVCFDYISGLGVLKYFYIQTIDTSNNNKGTNQTSMTNYDVTDAVASATTVVGSAVTPLAISWWKNQIRFDKNSKDEFAGTFDARMLMSIDNFDEVFGGVAGAEESVFDVGYIFNKGAAIDVDKAKAQVEGGTATYTQVKNAYVSTYFSSEKAYVMSCMIQNIPEADKTLELSAMAYVIYTDANGKTAYAYSPVKTSTFESLYNTNFSNAFPNA